MIVAVLVLAGVATWRFWPREPAPHDAKSYLQRELKRIQAADADDLPQSEQHIKAQLKADAGTDDLLRAYENEFEREKRAGLAEAFKSIPERAAPAGTNGWADFVKAHDCAERTEKAVGWRKINAARDGLAMDAATLATLLKQSQEIHADLERAVKADCIALPPESDEPPGGTQLARIVVARAAALLRAGERKTALCEARLALRAYSMADCQFNAIDELYDTTVWGILLEGLPRLSWTADELAALLDAAHIPALRTDRILEGETRGRADYVKSELAVARPHSPKDLEKQLDDSLKQRGYLPIGQLIELDAKDMFDQVLLWQSAARWAKQNPGDVLDGAYVGRLLDQLNKRDRFALANSIEDYARCSAALAAARLKLAWLRGERGAELDATGKRLAEASGFLTFRREGDNCIFEVPTDHPLHAYCTDDPKLAGISLPGGK